MTTASHNTEFHGWSKKVLARTMALCAVAFVIGLLLLHIWPRSAVFLAALGGLGFVLALIRRVFPPS